MTFLFLDINVSIGQVDLENGLVGCYLLEGDATDHSNYKINGIIQGNPKPVEDRFGRANSALQFDGINDYIELGQPILDGHQEFSFSAWVYVTEIPRAGEAFFFLSIGGTNGDQHILLGNNYSNNKHSGFSHGCWLVGNNLNMSCDNSLPKIGEWYHLVLVKTRTKYILYQDGIIVCDEDNTIPAFYGSTPTKATIGARHNYGQKFKGVLDDIHLYNRELTPDEIKELGSRKYEPDYHVKIESNEDEVCLGESVDLKIDSNNPNQYQWFLNDIDLQNNSENITHLFQNSYNKNFAEFSVKVSEPKDCFSPDPLWITKRIKVKDCSPDPVDLGIHIPNIFSPNNDNLNDNFEIINNSGYQLEISIFDRWGNLMYYNENYQNEWDGTYNKKRLPTGVYNYIIQYNTNKIIKGSIKIIY